MAWWLYSKQRNAPLRSLFWFGLIVKLLASIALGLIYAHFYNYNSDSFAYFNDAVVLSKIALKNPANYIKIVLFNEYPSQDIVQTLGLWSQPRAFFMAKLLSIFTLITPNNYWISGWYLSLFSFWGMWKLANTLANLFPATRLAAGVAFLFFPSVVFWSSGVMKESVVMGCIGGSVSYLLISQFKLENHQSAYKKVLSVAFIIFSCFILWQLKYYYLGALLPVCIAYIGATYVSARLYPASSALFSMGMLLVIFSGVLLVATQLHPNLYVDRFLIMLVENHRLIYEMSDKANVIHYNNLQPSFNSLLVNFPQALVAGLYRPFIWEASSLFQNVTGFENLLLLLFSLYALRPRNFTTISKGSPYYLLLLSTLLYIVFLAVLMAFASPNFGTLMRYKIGFLPLFIYLLLFNVFPNTLFLKKPKN